MINNKSDGQEETKYFWVQSWGRRIYTLYSHLNTGF